MAAARALAAASPPLRLEGLTVAFPDRTAEGGLKRAIDEVSFETGEGRVTALVGESGSGKTMVARAAIGLLPKAARVLGGRVETLGTDVTVAGRRALRSLRGQGVGLIFQEPMTALNPSMTVGDQMIEALTVHDRGLSRAAARESAVRMLDRLRIPGARASLARYPHEFSGGMRQRIMIASVMLPGPSLVIADEPTTALDAIVQCRVMALLIEVTREAGASVLLITHDLGVVADYAEDVVVMCQGRVMEQGGAARVLGAPARTYTRKLLESLPRSRRAPPAPADRDGMLELSGVRVTFPVAGRWPWSRRAPFVAVRDVSLTVGRGEVLALVGESGSGKTTLGRAALGLEPVASGRVAFDGTDLSSMPERRLRALRARMQLVFQDPYSSLDPRMRIAAIVAEGLRSAAVGEAERRRKVRAALEDVGLEAAMEQRYPHQLSGGQRQRVCIARALVMAPELVVADEPVAALDLTVQAQVLRLLKRLQAERGFTLLFISHDLAVVSEIADRVAVMCRGRLLELAPAARVFEAAAHPYTRSLLEASPYLESAGESSAEWAGESIVESTGTSAERPGGDGGRYAIRRRRLPPVPPPDGFRYAPPEAGDEDGVTLQTIAPEHCVAVVPRTATNDGESGHA